MGKERLEIMHVYIWGTGKMATGYLEQNELKMEEILGFIETKKSKNMYMGKKVFEPDEIVQRNDYDYIIVCVYYYGKEIYNICRKLGIDTRKLVLVDNWEWVDATPTKALMRGVCREINEDNIDIEKVLPKLYETYSKEIDIQSGRYIIVSRNGYDLCDNGALILSDDFQGMEYQIDYFRYRTFELMANEIIRKKVEGNVAEVGVFRGTFSKMISAKFSDKKLYLFDTFDSFDEDEFQEELTQGRCPEYFLDGFKNTNVENVLSIMPNPDKCIVKKGLFPDTTEGIESERYAFVSIDVDFEKSILAGLRYFYPRLSEGGAIFLHDYNNRFLEGVKKAVHTYEQEIANRLLTVPLADEGGTLVVVK
ncbi:MAG: TylF/MycF family methyltransferase [Lachnospiraceae bacterium]|nr:TylF/MycF family methyltransferase [Lachnospiraceae bacterium]